MYRWTRLWDDGGMVKRFGGNGEGLGFFFLVEEEGGGGLESRGKLWYIGGLDWAVLRGSIWHRVFELTTWWDHPTFDLEKKVYSTHILYIDTNRPSFSRKGFCITKNVDAIYSLGCKDKNQAFFLYRNTCIQRRER